MRDRIRRRPLVSTLLVLLVVTAAGASAGYAKLGWGRVSPAAVAAEIGAALDADSTAGVLHPGVHEVYATRLGQAAWRTADLRAAALDVLASAPLDALPVDSAFAALRAAADTARTAPGLGALDVGLTDALLRYGETLRQPRVDARALYGNAWTPAAPDASDLAGPLAEALASETPADAVEAWADALRPQDPGYRRLRTALAREIALRDLDLNLDRDLAPGDTGAAVVRLRDRLAVDDLRAPGTVATYDEALADLVRQAQTQHGLQATGRLDERTRRVLNQKRTALIPLLELNLERWRWLPRDLGDLHVWVNIPRFELALRERSGADWTEAIRFRAVVGSKGWETPVFSDTMETVVFNPTWTVPASIQRQSYGRVVGSVVRDPGPGNAMGRVKFLFPNAHAVYVHDTPSKWAFEVDDRARSHGCVRAGDPEGLARELLSRTNDGWNAERVAGIFRGPWRSQWVPLERPVLVHLVYFTAEVDERGRLHVYDDVYGRDAPLADALGLDFPDLAPDVVASLVADVIGDEDEVAAQDAEADEDETPAASTTPTTTSSATTANAPARPTPPRPTAAPRPAAPAAPARPAAPPHRVDPPGPDTPPAAPAPEVPRVVPPSAPAPPVPPSPTEPAMDPIPARPLSPPVGGPPTSDDGASAVIRGT